jgi:hypothetical protein
MNHKDTLHEIIFPTLPAAIYEGPLWLGGVCQAVPCIDENTYLSVSWIRNHELWLLW